MKNIFLFIFFVLGFLSLIIVLSDKLFFLPQNFQKKFSLGMDVAGGTILTYQVDLTKVPREDIKKILEQTKDLIERRINFLGVNEFFISFSESGRVLVEIPHIKNPEEAIKIIGETPFLEFRIPLYQTPQKNQKDEKTQEIIDFVPSGLTGKYLVKADVEYHPQTLEPYVSLTFNQEGAKIFKELTEKYLNKPLAIYLDNQLISAPIVREVIEDGRAQITGNFTLEEAKKLAQRLNQGALPAPLNLIAVSVVNPTLGEKFLDIALKGAVLGIILVLIFMIIFYGFYGVLADIALIFFILFNLALYKILPVTISLASLSAFVLSVGMAVDANILIFERIKEERKKGLDKISAIQEGFRRAFSSIRDSNFTTMISSLLIYFLATSFVKGFALTLFLGVLISFLTAVFLTHYLLEVFVSMKKDK